MHEIADVFGKLCNKIYWLRKKEIYTSHKTSRSAMDLNWIEEGLGTILVHIKRFCPLFMHQLTSETHHSATTHLCVQQLVRASNKYT